MSVEITKEVLDEVSYKDLQAKFLELGLTDVWKPGKKKDAMIQEALDKLKLVKSFENAGLAPEEVKAAVENVEQAQEAALQAEKVLEEESQEASNQIELEEAVELQLTLAQIEQNLATIEANLKNNIPAQRNILLKKKAMLQAMID